MAENNYDDLYDSTVVDQDDNKIGGVGQIYLDDETSLPTWITVKTGLFGTKETFVPLERAVITEGKIQVPYAEDFVKDAPNVDPDRHLDADEEEKLYAYYGIATVKPGDDESETDDVANEDAVVADETLAEDVKAGETVTTDAEDVAVADADLDEADHNAVPVAPIAAAGTAALAAGTAAERGVDPDAVADPDQPVIVDSADDEVAVLPADSSEQPVAISDEAAISDEHEGIDPELVKANDDSEEVNTMSDFEPDYNRPGARLPIDPEHIHPSDEAVTKQHQYGEHLPEPTAEDIADGDRAVAGDELDVDGDGKVSFKERFSGLFGAKNQDPYDKIHDPNKKN